ncbi:MAG: DUF3667 domain-containing protein [Chitinophagaceae bacterium]|nr:DUF3667 domain-containing protein [Chitinophagaceae bacterium]
MLSSNCLNCNTALEHGQRFCPTCGQSTKTHRLSITHFFHEAFHAVTHADKGVFHLLKCLSIRPGTTAKEYLQGRRKAYFNPFTFFLLIMGVFVFLNMYFNPPRKTVEPDTRVLARIPTETGKQNYIATMDRVDRVSGFTRNNGNILAMVAVPYISLITWAFFRKREYNYAEHLAANMMFITFSNLGFAVLVFPLQALTRNTAAHPFIVLIGMIVQVFYLAWSLNGFLALKSAGSRMKSFAVSFSAIVLWVLFTLTAIAVYIYQSKDFYKFFTRLAG